MQPVVRFAALAVALATTISAAAHAQGWIDPIRPILPGGGAGSNAFAAPSR